MLGGGAYGKGHLGVSFYVDQCVLRQWVVERGRLYGYVREQGLPVGVQEPLKGFRRRCVDYLSRKLVPKWESPNGEREMTTAGTTALLMEHIGVVA